MEVEINIHIFVLFSLIFKDLTGFGLLDIWHYNMAIYKGCSEKKKTKLGTQTNFSDYNNLPKFFLSTINKKIKMLYILFISYNLVISSAF